MPISITNGKHNYRHINGYQLPIKLFIKDLKLIMGNWNRIECANLVNFTTVRTGGRRMWFINNPRLEECTLGNLAKCLERYKVKIYAFALEVTHKHELCLFPECNRADFFRDFNSDVARGMQRYCKAITREGTKCLERRYSNEFVPKEEDIEAQFWYTVLQPVQDGLVASIEECPWYNCFWDAVKGIERLYAVINWSKYNSDKRKKKNIRIEDYTKHYPLKYARLPGYENLSQKEYEKVMVSKLRKKTKEIVQSRRNEGKGFMGRTNLLKILPGTLPAKEKKTSRWAYRPRILTGCDKTRHELLRWMFEMLHAHADASYALRYEGVANPSFPPGMYRPPAFTVKYALTHEEVSAVAA